MNDDWRLRVTLSEEGIVGMVKERLVAIGLEHDLEKAFADRVIVSIDGNELFAYAGTREQAERAEALIRREADRHEGEITTELTHWHAEAEQWEAPDEPVAPAEEHEERIADERAETAEQGYPEFEVRVQSDSREHASQLADMLRAEGHETVHRFKYLVLGAADEDGAKQLAERLRGLLPKDTAVTIEGSGQTAYYEVFRPGPFSLFGGVGGVGG